MFLFLQLWHNAHHGQVVPQGSDADQVRRLSVCLHHADGLLQHPAQRRGEHAEARGEWPHRARYRAAGAARIIATVAHCHQSQWQLDPFKTVLKVSILPSISLYFGLTQFQDGTNERSL